MGRNCDRSWLETIFDELQSEEPAMRYEAANACRELGEDEAIPRLAVLVNDDDLQVQVAAIQALGAIGGASVKKLLTELAQRTTDEGVREAAEAAVGEFEWQDPQPQFE
jgi:HEAT repeat protein